MNQTAFKTAGTCVSELDPRKHVKYTQGMVLGVEDFEQEFAYQINGLQTLPRETIGYGTVSGLPVEIVDVGSDDWKVSVGAGVALSPRGQFIRVAAEQCARIKSWWALAETKKQFAELKKADGWTCEQPLLAYVVLSYRDCPTDELPLPGEPCRCEAETMAPSRVIDDFRLEISLTPPPQREEDAVRAFVRWLWQVEVADFENGDLDYFLNAIRGAVIDPNGSTPPAPGAFFTDPQAGLRIPRKYLCEWMRAAMRLWVTELRPLWQASWKYAPSPCGCESAAECRCHGTGAPLPDDGRESLLLAQLTLTLDKHEKTITYLTKQEDARPFVVHLRMLQELMHCGPRCGCGEARSFATVFAVGTDRLQITIHHPTSLEFDYSALTLKLDEQEVVDFTVKPDAELENVFYIHLPDNLAEQVGNSYVADTDEAPAESGEAEAGEYAQEKSPPPAPAPGPRYPHCPVDVVKSIEVIFDASLVYECSTGSRDLATVIWQDDFEYADYHEPSLRVFGVANFGLDGEVAGWFGRTRLMALLGKPLKGEPKSGDILQYDGAKWSPAPLLPPDANSVEHSAEAGRYVVVAAGTMNRHGELTGYHGLRKVVDPKNKESILLTFGAPAPSTPELGYVQPDHYHAYIVKGTWIAHQDQSFTVDGFEPNGIRIKLPPVPSVAKEGGNKPWLMVEVSLFYTAARKPRRTP